MTNLLIFDPDRSCGALLRSYLRTLGHRVSVSTARPDAALKLATGLFDGVLLVSSASDDVLRSIDVAGLGVITLSGGQVEAQFPDGRRLSRTRHLASIGDVVRRLTDGAPEIHPAVIESERGVLECRAADLRMPSLLLEPEPEAGPRFTEYFATIGEAPLSARVQLEPERTVEGRGRCLFFEQSLTGAIERAAVGLS